MKYGVYIVSVLMVVFGMDPSLVVNLPLLRRSEFGSLRFGIMDVDGYARARIRVGAREKKRQLSTLVVGGYADPIRRYAGRSEGGRGGWSSTRAKL
jgi:hypothetical protein